MGSVRAGDKAVEGHDHLENHFSIAHVAKDRPERPNSSPIRGPLLARLESHQTLRPGIRAAPGPPVSAPSLAARRKRELHAVKCHWAPSTVSSRGRPVAAMTWSCRRDERVAG